MIETVRVRACKDTRRCLGNHGACGRRAYLIIHYAQFSAFLGQTKDGQQKILAARGVYPTGPEYQMTAARGLDGALACPLGASVDVQRVGRVFLAVGTALRAVEHIVGGV